MSTEPQLRLRKPLNRAIARGHPWVYRDALEPHSADVGSVVSVHDRQGRFLARGLAEQGAIAVRIWTTRDEPVDVDLIAQRLQQALTQRDRLALDDTNALRLVHGEGDRAPGLTLDQYATHAVLQLDGAAIAAWRQTLVDILQPLLRARGVEHLLERSGRGEHKTACALFGELPASPVTVREHGMLLLADLQLGQKTGLFLDHRDSRSWVRAHATDQRVLNLFGYTGAFSVAAGLGGAQQVVTVDSARPAILTAEQNWSLNGLAPRQHRAVCQPAERYLERDRARYDLVISDPPSFAPRKSALAKALGAYRALHRAALARVTRDGIYLAASCSSHVSSTDFERTLADGARAARRQVDIMERWGAAPDHPVQRGFAEGAYLKVCVVRVATSARARDPGRR